MIAPKSSAAAEDAFKQTYKKNYYQACVKEMTSGADRIGKAYADIYCNCVATQITEKLTVDQLLYLDKNPYAYEDFQAKVFSYCLAN
jgi:hypothetical protein